MLCQNCKENFKHFILGYLIWIVAFLVLILQTVRSFEAKCASLEKKVRKLQESTETFCLFHGFLVLKFTYFSLTLGKILHVVLLSFSLFMLDSFKIFGGCIDNLNGV